MEVKVLGICVRSEDYGEHDKIITLITLERGKLIASAKSVKKISSKLKAAASLLSYGEYSLVETKNRYILAGYNSKDNFMSCWQDIDKYASSQVIIETLEKIVLEDYPCESELKVALIALSYISHSCCYPFLYALWFLANIFTIVGIDLDDLTYIPSKDIKYLKSIISLNPDYLETLDISFGDLSELFLKVNCVLNSEISLKLRSISELIKLIEGKIIE